jgi:hypothetical protein
MGERKRLPMTAWYDPALLLQTGIRVAISTVFGQFADKREAIAAANAVEPQPLDPSFDYSREARDRDFWIDFLADTGDGWDSTYAMAQLVTDASLTPTGAAGPLPRGRILVLGGDQVYPTASRQAYDERFLGPFDEAFEKAPPQAKADMPDLYALPGNHDWYDGLGAFFNIFCRRRIAAAGTFGVNRPGRKVAGRPTKQTRSYFALKLREDWWLWAMDSQLEGSIDQPQIDYFQYVASEWMDPGANVVLCVGQPNWAYVNPDCPERQFETFSYLERLAGIARRPLSPDERKAGADPNEAPLMGHKLRAVLTGDSHHYSRFVEKREDGEHIHYITCGGGGAFLHPTHHLTDKAFGWDYPPPGIAGSRTKRGYPRSFTIADKVGGGGKALFPDAATSRALTGGNRGFALDNKLMTAVFIGAYLLFNWLLNANARIDGYGSLVHALTAGPIWQAPLRYVWMSFATPWPVLLFALAMAGYYYFADSPDDGGKRLRIGLGHGLVQAGAAVFVTSLLLAGAGRLIVGEEALHGIGPSLLNGLLLFLASAIAGVLAATIFGLYLARELNRFGRHWNEAFSSLAIADYKCFLRMKIDAAGDLHVYPVGLTRVPKGASTPVTLQPHLIEGAIVIPGGRSPAAPDGAAS